MNTINFMLGIHDCFGATGGNPDHVTLRLLCKNLAINPQIKLWDTWGVDAENYSPAQLSMLLQGRLPSNWNMQEFDAQKLTEAEASSGFRKPHAIVFFAPWGTLH
jgi:hypothetical protein